MHRNLTILYRAMVHRYTLPPPFVGVRWSSSERAPLLTATPVRALIDEPVSIKASFLPPHRPVTLHARMHSDDGDQWEAFAHYNTRADGTINLTRDHSVGGSYLGCEPMGLFWGLQPSPGGREGLRLRKKNTETPYRVLMSLLEGHVSPTEEQSTELAAITTERWYMAPDVRRIDIRQDGVVGTLFLPPGPGPFPAMLDLWGMGGGLVEYRSALFASRGYASLSLAYIGHKDLPGPETHINVNDDYFKTAFNLLRDHPQVCRDRVGIIGLSYGVFLALRLATLGHVKPSCVIAVNGPPGSTIQLRDGSTESSESLITFADMRFGDQVYVSFREVSLPSHLDPQSMAKLENLCCPLMYVLGEDDLSSLSHENANQIGNTLRAAGKSHLFTLLSYPGTGHLIEPPYTPHSRVSLWSAKPTKRFTLWGGFLAPHAAAQEDAWKKMLDFMESNLRL